MIWPQNLLLWIIPYKRLLGLWNGPLIYGKVIICLETKMGSRQKMIRYHIVSSDITLVRYYKLHCDNLDLMKPSWRWALVSEYIKSGKVSYLGRYFFIPSCHLLFLLLQISVSFTDWSMSLSYKLLVFFWLTLELSNTYRQDVVRNDGT